MPVVVAAAVVLVLGAVAVINAGDDGTQTIETRDGAARARFLLDDPPGQLLDARSYPATAARNRVVVYGPAGTGSPTIPAIAVVAGGDDSSSAALPVVSGAGDGSPVTVRGRPASLATGMLGFRVVRLPLFNGDVVRVAGRGVSDEGLLRAAAAVMNEDGGALRTELPAQLPNGFEQQYDGNDVTSAEARGDSDVIRYVDEASGGDVVELSVLRNRVFGNAAGVSWLFKTAKETTVHGELAVLLVNDNYSLLNWGERGAAFGLLGPPDMANQLLRIASTLRPATEDEWQRLTDDAVTPTTSQEATSTTSVTEEGSEVLVAADESGPWLEVGFSEHDGEQRACIVVSIAGPVQHCAPYEELRTSPSPVRIRSGSETVFVGSASADLARATLSLADGRTFDATVEDVEVPSGIARLRLYHVRVPDPEPSSGQFVFYGIAGDVKGDASFGSTAAAGDD